MISTVIGARPFVLTAIAIAATVVTLDSQTVRPTPTLVWAPKPMIIYGLEKNLLPLDPADKGHFHPESAEFWLVFTGRIRYAFVFGDDDPVGVETTRGTIVGVIADVRQVHLDRDAAPEIYFPIAQNWSQVSELGMSLVVAARERPDSLAGEIRTAIRDIDPSLAIFSVRTMEGVIADSLSDFRLFLLLMAIGAVAGVACLIPAWRASRANPLTALKAE